MAKHMRHQHNIIPEVHGRGGNRKRKREEPPAVEEPVAPGFATFKVEGTPNELPPGGWETDGRLSPPIDLTENSHIRRRSISPAGMSVMSTDDPDDLPLPESLLQNLDPETGLIEGKSVMAWRCIMAEQTVDYLLNEHEHLLEELRTVRNEELREKAAKEQALERFLRVQFGWVFSFECFCLVPGELIGIRPALKPNSSLRNRTSSTSDDTRPSLTSCHNVAYPRSPTILNTTSNHPCLINPTCLL